MFIQTEATPNPATVKFLPGCPVMENGVAEFTDAAGAAAGSPLAASLFALDGVTGVFFGADFISVTKADSADWDTLKVSVLGAVMDHFVSGAPLLREGYTSSMEKNDPDDELTLQIKELLETRVRPMVAMDGGDIVFDSFRDGIVYLKMRGACAGCPSSTATLKVGIENMLRHYVPEVREVRQAEE